MSTEPKSLADRYPRLRRAGVLILVAGGLAAYAAIKPSIPHDHPVAYRFDPDSAAVTELDVTWTRAGSETDDPIVGATYHFTSGTAPRELRATVRGPDGDYVVDIDAVTGDIHHRSRTRPTLSEGVAIIRVLVAEDSAPVPSPPPSSGLR